MLFVPYSGRHGWMSNSPAKNEIVERTVPLGAWRCDRRGGGATGYSVPGSHERTGRSPRASRLRRSSPTRTVAASTAEAGTSGLDLGTSARSAAERDTGAVRRPGGQDEDD